MNLTTDTTKTILLSPETTREVPFHVKSIEACLGFLESQASGLADAEVAERQRQFGFNQVMGSQGDIAKQLFLHQFKRMVSWLLVAAAAISIVMNQWLQGGALIAALLLSTGMSFLTKWNAQRALLSLESFNTPSCSVIRNGMTLRVQAVELVPGDILSVSSGQIIPADARLIMSEGLQVDESALTGESVLVSKDAQTVHLLTQEIPEQSNMLFAGTTVKTGTGQAVVTATGSRSQMGKIAALAQQAHRRQSHLSRSLNRIGYGLFISVCFLGAFIGYMGYQQGLPVLSMVQIVLVLLVAAVPEMLPAAATFILTLGIKRLGEEKAIVRSLDAIEAIGSTTVVCTDKTGTLTENALSVYRVYLPELGEMAYNPMWAQALEVSCPSLEELLRVGRLNNTTILDGVRSYMMGDPIDVALHRATPAEYELGYGLVKEYPFESSTMLMAYVFQDTQGHYGSMIKGAPEAVLSQCNYYLRPDGSVAQLDAEKRMDFLLGNQDLAMEGSLRVIGFAQKPLATAEDAPYENAVFLGWVCLIDPPKAGVEKAIAHCHELGLRVVMITGDQKATAAMLAKSLGILQEGDIVWTRKDLDSGLNNVPKSVKVFARTQPEEKLAIVQLLQASGEIVAMVGDGVNDAPALRKSDIAIAMGIRGAEAAKESADVVLLNDRFETIASAVMEGRILTNNVRLCASYLLSCNLGLVVLMAIAACFKFGFPLNALQILWLNLITVTIPALSLAFEPGNPNLLKRPSESYHQSILPLDQLMLVGFWSLLFSAVGLGAYYTGLLLFHHTPAAASTLAFSAIAVAQSLHLLNIQIVHSAQSPWAFLAEISRVPLTWLVLVGALVLQAAAIYVPFIQPVLQTAAIPLNECWLPPALAVGMLVLSWTIIRPVKTIS